MSVHKGAALLFDSPPKAKVLLGGKPVLSFAEGGDSDWLRAALAGRSIATCIAATIRCWL